MALPRPAFRQTFVTKTIPTSVKFCPFVENRFACTSAENYGLFGKGNLIILELNTDGKFTILSEINWHDCLFDLTWSELNPHHIVTSSGDGTLQLWNLNHTFSPVSLYSEHQKEVYSVQWNQTRSGQNFLSSSWDSSVKFWDVDRTRSLSTFGHGSFVYDAVWSPILRNCFASASGDGVLRVWDVNEVSVVPRIAIPGHQSEILACDWNKYNQNVLVTGGTDSLIRGWDLRRITQPIFELKGHQYAVRRVKFSPNYENILVSCSYDFTTRIWKLQEQSQTKCDVIEHHTEFVYGLDIGIVGLEKIVDCGWDKLIHVFHM